MQLSKRPIRQTRTSQTWRFVRTIFAINKNRKSIPLNFISNLPKMGKIVTIIMIVDMFSKYGICQRVVIHHSMILSNTKAYAKEQLFTKTRASRGPFNLNYSSFSRRNSTQLQVITRMKRNKQSILIQSWRNIFVISLVFLNSILKSKRANPMR